MIRIVLAALLGVALFLPQFAAAGAEQTIAARMAKIIPDHKPDSIRKTPVEGLYEVVYGPQVFYVTADGRYLLQGELVDLTTRQSLTDATLRGIRKKIIDAVPDSDTIVFAPRDGQVKHTITVFTDIDCPYCRKLHREIDNYLAEGIKVRYLLYPRAGKGSPSYRKAAAVWCAKDRQAALTRAKNGEKVDAPSCRHPVDEHMALGNRVGVTGTPAIVLESGDMVPGYRPAKELSALLDRLAARK